MFQKQPIPTDYTDFLNDNAVKSNSKAVMEFLNIYNKQQG